LCELKKRSLSTISFIFWLFWWIICGSSSNDLPVSSRTN